MIAQRPASPPTPRSLSKALLLVATLAACGNGVPDTATMPDARHAQQNPPMLAPAGDAPPLLGANPTPIFDYSRTPVYVDLMHQARRFGTPQAPWDEKAPLNELGWPVGDFGVLLMTGQRGLSGTGGTYHVRFKGQATVKPVASPAVIEGQHYDPVQNLSTLRVLLPDTADQLALSFTGTGSGIQGLQVIRPGYDPEHPPLFTRAFIDHIARFRVLRFMDWLRTNNNPVRTWAMRSTPEKTHFASPAGVPWEHIVALANQTGKDIWINIPVEADDDYIRQLSHLLRTTLNAESRIYIEYSNELWNAQFRQFQRNRELAIDEMRDQPGSPLAFDGSRDPNKWAFRRIAKRLKEISDLFRAEFGEAAMMQRIRPVFASQVVQPYVTELGLAFIAAVYGPPNQYFYALAGAPYLNLGDRQRHNDLSVDEVLQAMETSIRELSRINHLQQNVDLARRHGLRFMAYEGGIDTFGPGSLPAKKAASLDPRIQRICERYLEQWYAVGGSLFMWFTAGAGNWDTQYGTWELTTDLAITDTPKIRCLDSILSSSTVRQKPQP